MENLPDLPQLENIEVDCSSELYNFQSNPNKFLGSTMLALFAIYLLLHMYDACNFQLKYSSIIGLCILSISGLERCFIKVNKWYTDEHGLTARKIFWKNHIKWSDVREVKIKKSSFINSPTSYCLLTRYGKMWIPQPLPLDRRYALLIGSVRQHLRRIGKADTMEFPKQLEDLYWEIPNTIPEITNWNNPYPPSWQPLRALLIIKAVAWLLITGIGLYFFGWDKLRAPIYFITMFVGAVSCFLWYILHKDRTIATQVHIDSEGINAETGYGQVFLPWQDIRAADWSVNDVALMISSGYRTTIRIPNSNNAIKLLLVTLRNLRGLKKFECIKIPEEMRVCPRVR